MSLSEVIEFHIDGELLGEKKCVPDVVLRNDSENKVMYTKPQPPCASVTDAGTCIQQQQLSVAHYWALLQLSSLSVCLSHISASSVSVSVCLSLPLVYPVYLSSLPLSVSACLCPSLPLSVSLILFLYLCLAVSVSLSPSSPPPTLIPGLSSTLFFP